MKLAIIPIAALLMIPSWISHADEPYGYVKGSETRLQRASDCGRYISRYECDRIKAKNESRRRAAREDRAYDGGGKGCWKRAIQAKGAQRPGKAWATRLAKESWQREVRYDAGETYLSWSRARKIRGDYAPGITCNESGISSFGIQQYRCEANAIPCSAN